ncbi:hypothetical protein N7494_002774 [Penicillium frequentans]|uniref:Uncharacterized protein n=1 Tax=Penicillium frequentans TaxID=3151616 RepID=A0AAD6D4A3_9EURO|nr:hypothetical protein N7494_002774 [Penicillium glabrum]
MPTYCPNNHRLNIQSIWTDHARPLLGVETNLNLAAMPAADEKFAATVYIHVVIVQAEGWAHLVHTLSNLQDLVDQIMFKTESTT